MSEKSKKEPVRTPPLGWRYGKEPKFTEDDVIEIDVDEMKSVSEVRDIIIENLQFLEN